MLTGGELSAALGKSGSCGVVSIVVKSMPARGFVEGESVSSSEKSIFSTLSGRTATLFSIVSDPTIPRMANSQRKNTTTDPTTKASSPARNVLMKFIMRSVFCVLVLRLVLQR